MDRRAGLGWPAQNAEHSLHALARKGVRIAMFEALAWLVSLSGSVLINSSTAKIHRLASGKGYKGQVIS